MQTRLLLFDIDGTLMVSRGRGLRAMHAAIQQLHRLPPHPAEVLPHGKTDVVLFEQVGAAYGLAPVHLHEKLQELQTVYATHLERFLREDGALELKPGIRELLQALSSRSGVRLGLVTGNLERTSWLKLEAAGLARFFETGGYGSDARERSGLVAAALRRFRATGLTFEPNQVWVIGDTPEDVASGQAHGLRTLAVATGRHDRASLEASQPDLVLDDLSETRKVVDILCQ